MTTFKSHILCITILVCSFLGITSVSAVDRPTVSILTSEPTQMEVFTAWGHTAVRYQDPQEHTDVVFNYGVFDFSDPFSFCVNFVLGHTDYMLDTETMDQAMWESACYKHVSLHEQTLALTDEEARAIWDRLVENCRRQNRIYRYNFLYDNCATRPRLIIERTLNARGSLIDYNIASDNHPSYREIIHNALDHSPWYSFGIDICLGEPTDLPVSDSMQLFMPVKYADAIRSATINRGDTLQRAMLQSEQTLYTPDSTETIETPVFTPTLCAWILFVLILIHSIFYVIRGKRDYLWFDPLLFSAYGLIGIIVFFLTFISVHPCVFPNYNICWLNPLAFCCAIFTIERFRKYLLYFHITYAILIIMAMLLITYNQYFHPAFLPLMLTALMRSMVYIWRRKVGRL